MPANQDHAHDVIAIGRSSVDLYGQQIGSRLEDIETFSKSVGGCPANIAVGTARLGLKSGLITGVGAEQMGRFIIMLLTPTPAAKKAAPKAGAE